MTAANVIENVILKKKKIKQSKNKKKSWRKNINLSDIEIALEQQEEDERLGVLGEKISNLLFLDTNDGSNTAEEDSNAVVLDVPLEYTIDTGTGLKSTGRPKEDKILHAHRFLAGLPGAKAPQKRCRFRKEHTLDYKLAKERASLANPKRKAKEEFKQERAKQSLKLSKVQKKTVQKLSFSNNLWATPEVTKATQFTADGIEHHNRTRCIKSLARRGSALHPNKIPAVPVPHAGLSYNPTLESHQKLLSNAVQREVKRGISIKKMRDAKTKNFPLGALPVNEALLIGDMDAQHRASVVVKEESDEDSDTAATKALPNQRTTHKERLRTVRRKRRLRDKRLATLKIQRESEVDRIEEFNEQMDKVDADLRDRASLKRKREAKKQYKSPRFYHEQDVEVALGDELHSSLRLVHPTSNPVKEVIQHIYRRGFIHSKSKDRMYAQGVRGINQRRVKGKAVDPFTEEDFKKK